MSSGDGRDTRRHDAQHITLQALHARIKQKQFGEVGIAVIQKSRGRIIPASGRDLALLANQAEQRGVELTYTKISDGPWDGYQVSLCPYNR